MSNGRMEMHYHDRSTARTGDATRGITSSYPIARNTLVSVPVMDELPSSSTKF